MALARARGALRPRPGLRLHLPRVRHLGGRILPRHLPRGAGLIPVPPHLRVQRALRRPPPRVLRAAALHVRRRPMGGAVGWGAHLGCPPRPRPRDVSSPSRRRRRRRLRIRRRDGRRPRATRAHSAADLHLETLNSAPHSAPHSARRADDPDDAELDAPEGRQRAVDTVRAAARIAPCGSSRNSRSITPSRTPPSPPTPSSARPRPCSRSR